MWSLQARLASGLLLSLLAIFLVLWLVVSGAIRNVAQDYIASRLGHDSETLLANLNFSPDGTPLLDVSRMDSIYQRPFSGHYYQVINGDKVLRSRSLWDDTLKVTLQANGVTNRVHLQGPQHQPLLAVVSGYQKQGQSFTMVIAEDLTSVESNIRGFQYRFGIITVCILFLMGAAIVIMVRRGLSPLKRLQQEVRELEHGQRQQLSKVVPTEVSPLVGEVNHLLEILNTRLLRSRHALGDLAHALKKPLTLLRHMENEDSVVAQPQLRQELATQVSAMQQTIDHVLRRARLAGEGHAGTVFDVDQDLPLLTDTLQKMYRDKGIQIYTDVTPGLHISVDREDMLELLGNLLDNACKWARQQVHLSIQDGEALILTIEDDGPGIDAKQIADLSQRGKRLDESVEGHGLGLAIVQDIAEQYRGSITYSRSASLGGLQVTVTLPR